jgi:hypothetical protein
MEKTVTTSAKLFRELTAEEVAALPQPPHGDVETPTTSLRDMSMQSTAEAHIPGVAASARYADAHHPLPDPTPLKEN